MVSFKQRNTIQWLKGMGQININKDESDNTTLTSKSKLQQNTNK